MPGAEGAEDRVAAAGTLEQDSEQSAHCGSEKKMSHGGGTEGSILANEG